jgi:hypothetical protein
LRLVAVRCGLLRLRSAQVPFSLLGFGVWVFLLFGVLLGFCFYWKVHFKARFRPF